MQFRPLRVGGVRRRRARRHNLRGLPLLYGRGPTTSPATRRPTSFLVVNPGSDVATVSLEQPAGGGTWSVIQQATVAGGGGGASTVGGPQDARRAASRLGRGLRLKHAARSRSSRSPATTPAKGPRARPGRPCCRRACWDALPRDGVPAVADRGGRVDSAAPGGAGRLLIVGTQDQTHVTFTPSGQREDARQRFGHERLPGRPAHVRARRRRRLPGVDRATTSRICRAPRLSRAIRWRCSPATSRPPTGRRRPGSIRPTWRTSRFRRSPPGATSTWPRVAAPGETCDTLLGQTGTSLWRLLAQRRHAVSFDGARRGGRSPAR